MSSAHAHFDFDRNHARRDFEDVFTLFQPLSTLMIQSICYRQSSEEYGVDIFIYHLIDSAHAFMGCDLFHAI